MHIPTAAPVPAKPLPIYRQLYFQVIVAIVPVPSSATTNRWSARR